MPGEARPAEDPMTNVRRVHRACASVWRASALDGCTPRTLICARMWRAWELRCDSGACEARRAGVIVYTLRCNDGRRYIDHQETTGSTYQLRTPRSQDWGLRNVQAKDASDGACDRPCQWSPGWRKYSTALAWQNFLQARGARVLLEFSRLSACWEFVMGGALGTDWG